MKKTLSILGNILILIVLFGIISIFFSAIPGKSQRKDTKPITGKLVALSTCCPGGDITFHLDNEKGRLFYINRAEEHGLSAKQLAKELTGKQITLLYHKRGWNIINFLGRVKHVCEVRHGNKVYYTELLD